PLGRFLVEARPQSGCGQVRCMQRNVGRPLRRGPETTLPTKGKADNPGDQDHHGDQSKPQGLFHATPNGDPCTEQCATEGHSSGRRIRWLYVAGPGDAARRSKATVRRCWPSLQRSSLVERSTGSAQCALSRSTADARGERGVIRSGSSADRSACLASESGLVGCLGGAPKPGEGGAAPRRKPPLSRP